MADLNFCSDVCTSAQVLGRGLRSSLAEWEQSLGNNYVDDERKGRLRRDYGIVELSFARMEGNWECMAISVQVHRLALPHEDVIPEVIARRYGKFRERVPFVELERSIREGGASVELISDAVEPHPKRFWVPSSQALVHVVDEPLHDADGPRYGDVWSIALSRDAQMWREPLT